HREARPCGQVILDVSVRRECGGNYPLELASADIATGHHRCCTIVVLDTSVCGCQLSVCLASRCPFSIGGWSPTVDSPVLNNCCPVQSSLMMDYMMNCAYGAQWPHAHYTTPKCAFDMVCQRNLHSAIADSNTHTTLLSPTGRHMLMTILNPPLHQGAK